MNKQKRWDDVQIFFVYDTKCLLKEDDDPRDALVYFHPSSLPDTIRCTLCCQLMGIVQFCNTVFSPPTMINLQKKKFALKIAGRYALGLAGTTDMPDSILHRQLSSLFSLFTFYHESLDVLFEKCNFSTSKLEDAMEPIWVKYLPVSQHFGNTQSLTFNVLPSLDLPKSAGILFLRATQILECCRNVDGVISGCILSNKQVVCTLLPPSIVHLLWFISPNKPELLGTPVKTIFPLPDCTFLVYVYLTEDQISDIDSMLSQKSEKAREMTSQQHENTLNKLVLYIQGNSETQLMLLMKEDICKDPTKITTLWKIGLSSLVDLEMDVKSCWENTMKKDLSTSYLYMQYDQTWAAMKGHMISPSSDQINEQLFNRSTQLIHELLNDDPSIQSFSLLHANSVIYAHSLGSLQTFCQFNLKNTVESSKIEKTADILLDVEGMSKMKLERDHDVILL